MLFFAGYFRIKRGTDECGIESQVTVGTGKFGKKGGGPTPPTPPTPPSPPMQNLRRLEVLRRLLDKDHIISFFIYKFINKNLNKVNINFIDKQMDYDN